MDHRASRNWLVTGIGLVLLAGCQSDTTRQRPGALPMADGGDVSPRLNASTYFAHGHLCERQGNYEQAVKQYRKALEVKPDFLSAMNRLGIALNKLGWHAEATAQFRQAIQQAPTESYLHNNLGFSLYLEGRFAAARNALEDALELQPSYPRARMNYAITLAKLREYDEAYDQFCLVTTEPDALYNLGVIQTELGEYAEAARSLELALAANPELEAARQQLHIVSRLTAEAEALHDTQDVIVRGEPAEPGEHELAAHADANPDETTGVVASSNDVLLARGDGSAPPVLLARPDAPDPFMGPPTPAMYRTWEYAGRIFAPRNRPALFSFDAEAWLNDIESYLLTVFTDVEQTCAQFAGDLAELVSRADLGPHQPPLDPNQRPGPRLFMPNERMRH